MECESCECKVKKYRWNKHGQTMKYIENKRIKRKEEVKLGKVTVEEKHEYNTTKKLKQIWNRVEL